jgi:RHS repeat-associated protein
MGGSFSRSVSPQQLPSATYNAANQQLAFGSQTLSYDLNGNLTSDGENTYTWDARNRLVSMSGPGVNASFEYDAAGRRSSKTVNGTTTSFLHDGSNVVQEQSVQVGNANLLNGGIDEIFTRSDSSGLFSPLLDGLGSYKSLTDSAGSIQTEYSYDAFGQTTSTGASSNNSSQYTGRENDGVTYYYRARYYSPTLQRFISEDPMEFAGGDINLYAYVSNDPVSYVDPSGNGKFKYAIQIVRRFGEYLRPNRVANMKEAQNAAKRGADVMAPDKRTAEQIYDGAFKNDPSAGTKIHHDAHPRADGSTRGRYPHFQASGRPGQHIFYRAGMFFAPFSMNMAGRKDATTAQIASAALWDGAGAIDPIGITDALNWGLRLDE